MGESRQAAKGRESVKIGTYRRSRPGVRGAGPLFPRPGKSVWMDNDSLRPCRKTDRRQLNWWRQ